MKIRNTKESALLFAGDCLLLFFALWLTLFFRYLEVPRQEILELHLWPFAILIGGWICAFYIAGLYRKQTLLFRSMLPTLLLHVQIFNSVVAVSFFYFIPFFSITPKINLFLFLGFSFLFLLAWRLYGHTLLGFRKRERALLIGSGTEVRELFEEVNMNRGYGLQFIEVFDPGVVSWKMLVAQGIALHIESSQVRMVVLDLHSPEVSRLASSLYPLIFKGVRFIDMHTVYEDLFDRVPLSMLGYSWFLENVSASSAYLYDLLKRFMDACLALALGVCAFPLVPLVFLLIKLDDGGPAFIVQYRLGKNNVPIMIRKFRTMKVDTGGLFSALEGNYDRITRVGSFLRKTRIDELPQLWSVFAGDLSLIGPRPELPELAEHYEKEIPYYKVRHLIKPGLSGWAQIHQALPPKFGLGVDMTKIKLSYDLYYIKHRSLMLDLKIALRTIKTLFSRSGL